MISILGQQKHLVLDIEPCDFLTILAISSSISYIKLFHQKIACNKKEFEEGFTPPVTIVNNTI